MIRKDGRRPDEIRPVVLTKGYVDYPEGSVLITMGKTRILCNVSLEDETPRWVVESGILNGWITSEYALLPRSTHRRTARENKGLRGRTQEIRRMIGRSLRAGFDLTKFNGLSCIVDCDVIQADAGTRTAAITGGYAALRLALQEKVDEGFLSPEVFLSPVAAISAGISHGKPLLDLCYEEDSAVDVDINVVMNADRNFIEIQGTAEGAPLSRGSLIGLLDLAEGGIIDLLNIQKKIYT